MKILDTLRAVIPAPAQVGIDELLLRTAEAWERHETVGDARYTGTQPSLTMADGAPVPKPEGWAFHVFEIDAYREVPEATG